MSDRHRCSDDVHLTENVSVGFESAGALVFPIVGVIFGSTHWAGLACIPRIDKNDVYSRQRRLVLDKLGQAIEAPVMEIFCVLAACSCSLADASEFFHLDGFDNVCFGKVDNCSRKLMVLILHPATY